MDLEEAKANIGKEVVHIKTNENYIIDSIGSRSLVFVKKKCLEKTYYVDPHLLKLKDQPMKNYKIKVTPETSAEVQELFFELGYSWVNGNEVYRYPNMKFIYVEDGIIFYRNTSEYMGFEYQEITLPQLRDLVVLKRNDMNDATHKNKYNKEQWYVTSNNELYYYHVLNRKWQLHEGGKIDLILKESSSEMTWQDALRYLENGEDVEFYNQTTKIWHNLLDSTIRSMRASNGKFRLKPQTIYIDGGDYTKEELLKIVGEME